jgi:hypothetical protein
MATATRRKRRGGGGKGRTARRRARGKRELEALRQTSRAEALMLKHLNSRARGYSGAEEEEAAKENLKK